MRDTDVSALSALRTALNGHTEALAALAVEMYARGCSTRDIEAMFRDETGRSLLSRTAVSEYKAFATRDLSSIKPLYLFLDGIAERLTPGFKREAVQNRGDRAGAENALIALPRQAALKLAFAPGRVHLAQRKNRALHGGPGTLGRVRRATRAIRQCGPAFGHIPVCHL